MAHTATAVSQTDRGGGNLITGTFTADPASTATLTADIGTINVPGVKAGDVATLSVRTALTAGMIIAYVRCATDVITYAVFNATAGTIDQTSFVGDFAVFRGSSIGRL